MTDYTKAALADWDAWVAIGGDARAWLLTELANMERRISELERQLATLQENAP